MMMIMHIPFFYEGISRTVLEVIQICLYVHNKVKDMIQCSKISIFLPRPEVFYLRLNCSFSLLTFLKLRFWPLRKKTTKQPL